IGGDLQHVARSGTRGGEHCQQVRQRLARLHGEGLCCGMAAVRARGELAGDEDQVLVGDGLGIMPRRRRDLRREDGLYLAHAPSPMKRAKLARSTLPPLRMTPTRLPSTGTAPVKAAAAARQPVGSTTSFMRSAKKRIAATRAASGTV